MKWVLTSAGVLALVFFALASGKKSASARGGFPIHDHGVASVQFVLEQDGDGYKGELVYAADDHSHDHGDGGGASPYPAQIITLSSIEHARFQGQVVEFSGRGTYNNEAVHVQALARDGKGTGKKDFFHIRAIDDHGNELYHRHGELETGDIDIKGGKK